MSAERVYAVLLRLYPRRFRERYGHEALQTFTELSVAMDRRRVRFWSRVLTDFARSVAREHIDEWTCGDASLAIRWIAACAIGSLVVRSVVPPLQQISQSPDLAIITTFVFVLGAAQGWALKLELRVASFRDNFARLVQWSLTSGLAVAAGAAVAWGVDAALGRLGLVGVGAPYSATGDAVDFVLGSLAFGLVVGLCQAVLLVWAGGSIGRGMRLNDAARFVGWTIAALPAFMLCGRITHPLFPFSMDWWWSFGNVVVRPIENGAILGLLTVRPIATVVARGRHSEVSGSHGG